MNIRPHIIQCLTEIQKKYHTIIYTASDQSYADSVLDFIDPLKEYFKVRLYRHNCVKIVSDNGTIYIKDLRIIRNVSLKNMIIIDNSVLSFAFHLENGIPVLPYYNNKNDNELIYLKDYLLELHNSDNFIETNNKVFNLKRLMNEALEESDTLEEEEKSSDKRSSSPEEVEEKEEVAPLELFDNSKNNILEKKLNRPVRRDSKYQDILSETLQNAHNVLSQHITGNLKNPKDKKHSSNFNVVKKDEASIKIKKVESNKNVINLFSSSKESDNSDNSQKS